VDPAHGGPPVRGGEHTGIAVEQGGHELVPKACNCCPGPAATEEQGHEQRERAFLWLLTGRTSVVRPVRSSLDAGERVGHGVVTVGWRW